MEKQFTVTPLPFFFISRELAGERIGNYGSNQHSTLSTALGRSDTRSLWYSRDHIAKLLEEIDLVSGDGLRIFLGAYESGHDYEGQTCFVMVPTREELVDNTVIHRNVILEDEPGYEDRLSLAREIWAPLGSEDLSELIKNFDHGSPCPPSCDGTDGLAFYE